MGMGKLGFRRALWSNHKCKAAPQRLGLEIKSAKTRGYGQ